MKLSEYAIKKPITAVMVALSLIVMGFISLFRLPLEYAPDLQYPRMYVSFSYPSSSPEEIEKKITKPIEEILGTIPGVEALRARSYGSRGYVVMEYDYGTDMDLKSIQVRDRIDQIRNQLPEDLERIEMRRWDSSDWEILDYNMIWLGDNQSELATVYKNTILPRLQRIPGVGNVEMEGADERILRVDVDKNRMHAHGLDIRTLNRTIRSNNINISGGYVTEGDKRLAVRAVGEFENVDQIRDLTLPNGLDVQDVAQVSYDYPEKRYFERMDGRDVVSMEIRKTSTANLVETCRLVRAELDALQDEIGRDKLRLHLRRDQSEAVVKGIASLGQSAILGGMLAIGIIFVFLRNFRSTLIVGSAIPISVLCVFMIMYLMRQVFGSTITLNMISMMGLMVAIGMLVDPAVVALENIYRRRFDVGDGTRTAAIEGSREIGIPVLAAALTTICVFVPLIFISGSYNTMWMRDFAITVCIAVVAALCVALTLIPLACSRAFSNAGTRVDLFLKIGLGTLFAAGAAYLIYQEGIVESATWFKDNTLWILGGLTTVPILAWIALGAFIATTGYLFFRFRHLGLKGVYTRVISTTLHYRWTTVVVATFILFGGIYIFTKIKVQRYRYQPDRLVGYVVEMPRTYDIDDALALFKQVEAVILPHKEKLDIEAMKTRYSTRRGNRIYLYLKPVEESPLSTDDVKKRVSALLPKDIPGVRFKAGFQRGGSSGTGVGVEIKGRNPEVLAILAEDIRLRMNDIEGIHDVETSLESGTEEIRVSVRRDRAQQYGLSPQQIATTVATALGARGNSKFKTPDGEIDIALQLREEDRATLDQLKTLSFENNRGTMISFASLADFELTQGPQSIERQDRMSTVTVFANTEASEVQTVGYEMRDRMDAIPLPQGYSWQMDRRFRYMASEEGETNFTMIFAALLIYLIMASLFESYVHPFTIMFSISFAFIGVALGLYTFGIALDSNATYGLLILFGIVVNNGIVLIDHINRYRKQGLYRRDAILRGGQDRLRPILMTATTTILGLTPLVIPMIYGNAEGNARRWGPIGLVIISGLSISTILTLVILPTIYSLMDDMSGYAKRIVAVAKRA